MKRYVLDSYALISYAEGEEGGKSVAELFKKALVEEAELFLCWVNWGEMYYITLRENGEEHAEQVRSTFAKYPFSLIDADEALTLQAARYKAKHGMSYADAFAAALAKLKKAELVTGDKEFKPLEHEFRVYWI